MILNLVCYQQMINPLSHSISLAQGSSPERARG
jgi:hypothetical protein